MVATADTRIIFVHGLASKPPADDLFALWRKALIENVRVDSRSLATALDRDDDLWRNAYWANAVPDHIEDTASYVRKLGKAVDTVIAVRKKERDDLHISKSGWAASKLKKFGLGIVSNLAAALTIKDNVIDEQMREVRIYRGDQYIADRIRAPLEDALRQAWDDGKRVMILSHSMGTLIAYDVLWRFSHRSEPAYKKYRNKRVGYFVTMGSPLGDPTLREFMLIDRWSDSSEAGTKAERKRYFPTNIDRWHNYSAYGDVVCHDSTLDDDFFDGLRKEVGGFGRKDLRDYTRLYNPYENTDSQGNPHKSYGYLIQPKLSQNVRRFFGVT
jgi:hypothetical protein